MFILSALGWFFAGVFLTNATPHLIHGLAGNRFPSPFDKPHGKKLSSPVKNVIWAFMNLAAFSAILWFNGASFNGWYLGVFGLGAFGMGLFLATYFAQKDKE